MSGAGFLLDTNVVSELRRKRPEPRVLQWFEQVDNRQLSMAIYFDPVLANKIDPPDALVG